MTLSVHCFLMRRQCFSMNINVIPTPEALLTCALLIGRRNLSTKPQRTIGAFQGEIPHTRVEFALVPQTSATSANTQAAPEIPRPIRTEN
jgi:hypothetical protein